MSRVAVRYSKALFALAEQEGAVDSIQDDLNMIKTVFLENPELNQAMVNPLIGETVKSRLLSQLFKEGVSPLTFRFLELLSRKKRSGFLLEMIAHYTDRVLEYNGVLSGELRSAQELDSGQMDEIKASVEAMTGKKVQLRTSVDDTLIGGFIVKIKDRVVDLSIKTQLEKLRTQLVHG